MKKLLFILSLIALLFTTATAQTQVFALEHNGNTSIYSTLDSAINAAQNGAVIYLPGGGINFQGELRKSVALIGAGYHPNTTVATGPTVISGIFKMRQGANNVMITGIHFSQELNIDSCNNVTVSRCHLNRIDFNRGSSFNVSECVISDFFSARPIVSNVNVSNSLIFGSLSTDNGGVTYINNILFPFISSNNRLFQGADGNTFQNNIIVTNSSNGLLQIQGIGGLSGNTYYNNVFTDSLVVTSSSPGVYAGNIFKQSQSSLFQNITSISTFSPSDNLHLKAGSAAIGAGINGTDCGIYGGQSPFKDGGIPFSPHIESLQIDPATDVNGSLRINIKVTAQDR
ncbi:hypothetical protein [Owenweeksia hongkongensis]|uniref:hypothetical protein n=1 Tax=Owenweeksia hongkongensis TaxID=253245 RepID=UPI003A90F8A9